jgi:hypothetical protein
MDANRTRATLTSAFVSFAIVTSALVIVAHAIAYMTHEYSHTFVAWALGWMSNPLALDYGKPTLYNLLFLGDVADNVNYDPIFAAGRGIYATIIALAGTFLGNGLLYIILYLIAGMDAVASSRWVLSFTYWLALMCAGNVWSYVPIRAITTHADIAIAAKGLHVSTWTLFPFLLIPSLYITHHFFGRMMTRCIYRIADCESTNLALVIALTSYWFFVFFGGDGTDGSYGLVSQLFAITSKYFLFPISVMYLSARYRLPQGQAPGNWHELKVAKGAESPARTT